MSKKMVLFFVVALCAVLSMFAFSGCSEDFYLKKAEYDTVKQTKMDNFTLLNDSAETGQIVMCGDSIVELYPQELLYDFPSQNSQIVYNRGISGDSSVGLKKRFADNVLKINPSIVSILIGTNDLSMGIPLATVRANLKDMIVQAKAKGVDKIIVQSIYPVNHEINPSMVGARKNSDIDKWNNAFKEICDETGAVYADVNTKLQDSNGKFKAAYTYDGLHPNAAGYIEITKIIEQYFIV